VTLPNPSTALAQVVVDEMARNGVRRAVLAPGSRSGALALALATHPRIQLHVAIDERSAGFFALGSGKAGQPAVVVTTSGTAAGNLYPAIIEADVAGTPLIVCTADRPPELRHAGANQTIDQVKLYGERVRWFAEMGPGEDRPGEAGAWRSIVCQAVSSAIGNWGRPGPVHVNLTFREPLVPSADDGRASASPYGHEIEGRPDDEPWTGWDPASSPVAVEVETDGRVLMVMGDQGDPDLARQAMEAGWVVVAEAHSGARIPGTITTAHHLLATPSWTTGALPDLIVQVGRVGVSRNLAGFVAGVSNRMIVSRHGWPDPERTARRWVPAVRPVAGSTDLAWVERWSKAEKRARTVIDDALDRTTVPDEARAARDIAAAVPDGGTLVVGSSMPVRDLDWFMAARNGLRVVANRGASGIDGFVSTALGVAAAGPPPTVALGGDLTLLHDRNGWLTQPSPDLVMVVVNNNGGGIFSFLPQAGFPEHFESLFATPRPANFEMMATEHGLEYQFIELSADLGPAIAEAITDGGRHLLEIRTDRTDNVARHRQLTSLVAAEISSLFES
jgi:2-succinyl-5-enolpyruvyl-6-hydroxy-3-cyclohexene-1-carboxylate synthase